MSHFERVGRVLRHILAASMADDEDKALMAAQLAVTESQVAAALALYVQNDGSGVSAILGHPQTPAGAVAGIPILCAFDAAREAITAAVGDDPTRGFAAIRSLQERAAEYREAAENLATRGQVIPPTSTATE